MILVIPIRVRPVNFPFFHFLRVGCVDHFIFCVYVNACCVRDFSECFTLGLCIEGLVGDSRKDFIMARYRKGKKWRRKPVGRSYAHYLAREKERVEVFLSLDDRERQFRESDFRARYHAIRMASVEVSVGQSYPVTRAIQ